MEMDRGGNVPSNVVSIHSFLDSTRGYALVPDKCVSVAANNFIHPDQIPKTCQKLTSPYAK